MCEKKDPMMIVQIIRNTINKQGCQRIAISLYLMPTHWSINLFDQAKEEIIYTLTSSDSQDDLLAMIEALKGVMK
jgi:hypothetical protein